MAQPFGHDIPRLSWLGGKTYPTHFASRKNRPGNQELHTEAIVEDATLTLAKRVAESFSAPVEPEPKAPIEEQ